MGKSTSFTAFHPIAHDYTTAMEVIDRGLTLAASSALGLSFGSVILGHAGEADRAIDYAERTPHSGHWTS